MTPKTPENWFLRQVRQAEEDIALLGGIYPADQVAHARKREVHIKELEKRLESVQEPLCVDEGCPQYGTKHICVSINRAIKALDMEARKWGMFLPDGHLKAYVEAVMKGLYSK